MSENFKISTYIRTQVINARTMAYKKKYLDNLRFDSRFEKKPEQFKQKTKCKKTTIRRGGKKNDPFSIKRTKKKKKKQIKKK